MIVPGSVIPTQIGPTRFLFRYASDLVSPTFYIWLDGVFVEETLATEYEVTLGPGGQLQFDVFDAADDEPAAYFPSRFTLRWDGEPDSVYFRVEQKIAGNWAALDTVPSDDRRVFHYTSGVLADSVLHEFRIVPLDAQGRSGVVLDLKAEMCRYPDTPAVALAGAGGEITIS